MPIPIPNEKLCVSRPRDGAIALPVLSDPKRTIKKSKMGPIRAAVLIGVHVVIAIHIGLWLASGKGETMSPVEPSEAMYTLEQGLVNAGFIFFGLALLSTAVLGRWFCGWACHIVALQDLCAWIMKKCGIKPKPFRSRLLVLAPLLLALYMFVYPTVNREIFKPLAGERWPTFRPYLGEAGPRPVLRSALTKKDFWGTFEKNWYVIVPFFGVCGFAAVYFLGSKGFCTYGCPYGGFFAPLDKIAPGRILVTDACEHCGHCTSVCTSNVRVHEEVRDYGMVVDPGCMKCMDCVSVCPNDALYFGFARPSIAKKARTPGPIQRFKSRVYDLTWTQELVLAALMLGLFLAYRNMMNHVPMLMAMGMAGIGVFLAWKLWQLIREPSVRLQNLQLKIKGALRPAGLAFGSLAVLLLATGAWSGAVRSSLFGASLIDDAIKTPQNVVFSPGYKPNAADLTRADRALVLYRFSGPPSEGGIGWHRSPDDYIRMAWLSAVAGRLDDADATVKRGIDCEAHGRGQISPGLVEAVQIVTAARGGGPPEAAGIYRQILADHPGLAEVRLALAALELSAGDPGRAAESARTALRERPHDPAVVAKAVPVLLQTGHVAEAEPALREAIRHEPRDSALAYWLAVTLTVQGRGNEAVDQFKQAFALDPHNAMLAARLAEVLRALGREREAAEWEQTAESLRSGRNPAP